MASSSNPQSSKDRQFIAVIGDEVTLSRFKLLRALELISNRKAKDSVTGLLLAGVGHVTSPPNVTKNFLVVDAKTETSKIEKAFDEFIERKDIAILLINQHVRPSLVPRTDFEKEGKEWES